MAHFDIAPDIRGQTAEPDALLRGRGYARQRGNRLCLACSTAAGDDPLVARAREPAPRGLAVEAITREQAPGAPAPAEGLRKGGPG